MLALIIGATFEELLPKPFNTGWPILLSIVQYTTCRRSIVFSLLFAISAGAFEDALGNMPFLTSIGYFALVVVVMKWVDMPRGLIVLTFPVYQLWLWLWLGERIANLPLRLWWSLPVGLITAVLVTLVLDIVNKKAAADEQG